MKLNQYYQPLFKLTAQFTQFITWPSKQWQSVDRSIAARKEPRVWQREYQGEMLYDAYDPAIGQSLRCATEAEVRLWLDQLPYTSNGEM